MKAKARGYVSPIGRCGKSLTWDRVEIERYKRQGPRLVAKWVMRWRRRVRKTSLPGVWELETGGYLVRGQVTVEDQAYEINRVVQVAKAVDALNELKRLKKERRVKENNAIASLKKQSERFSVFATSLLDRLSRGSERRLGRQGEHDAPAVRFLTISVSNGHGHEADKSAGARRAR